MRRLFILWIQHVRVPAAVGSRRESPERAGERGGRGEPGRTRYDLAAAQTN
jgi:hypothetical protein